MLSKDEKEIMLRAAVEQAIPFNQVLGIKLEETDPLSVSIDHRPELVGNSFRNMLHGGVISAVLDVIGGICIMKEILDTSDVIDQNELIQKITRVGTVDLRVDYVRPGRGSRYIATSEMIRYGARIAVTRMTLVNDQDEILALGTGTYVV